MTCTKKKQCLYGDICPTARSDEYNLIDASCYKPLEQTNEDWFDTLSTEEKAKFFHGIVIRAMQATWDGKKPDYPAYLSDWKKWLKEKHE